MNAENTHEKEEQTEQLDDLKVKYYAEAVLAQGRETPRPLAMKPARLGSAAERVLDEAYFVLEVQDQLARVVLVDEVLE